MSHAGTASPLGGQVDWLSGAIDFHVHAGPSFFPRWGDGPAVATVCRDAGMAGVLLKAHEGTTVEVAAALSVTHAPLRVAGGVVLNRYVGGVNPDAALASVKLGGRCLWFPTIDSDDHVRAYGTTGAYDRQAGGTEDTRGISILDADGELTDAAKEVLAIARDEDVCVATYRRERSIGSSTSQPTSGCDGCSCSIPASRHRRSTSTASSVSWRGARAWS